jgi:hypothetical protein
MPSKPLITRLRKLGWSRTIRLAETTLMLALASAAIAVLPFRWLTTMLGRSTAPPRHPAADEPEIAAAVRDIEAAARRLPWKIVCFQKGVALHWILARRGIPTVVHYGVGQSGEKGLTAHVWISAHGRNVLGGEIAQEYVCLATFPASEPGATEQRSDTA